MPTDLPTIPPDDPKRNLTLAQPDNLPHIGLVGDTYTITVTGDETDGHVSLDPTPDRRMRKRKKKGSNREWMSPADALVICAVGAHC
jgi:hypothetical protein